METNRQVSCVSTLYASDGQWGKKKIVLKFLVFFWRCPRAAVSLGSEYQCDSSQVNKDATNQRKLLHGSDDGLAY